jgi:hypothetical protein
MPRGARPIFSARAGSEENAAQAATAREGPDRSQSDRGSLNAELARTKPGVRLINCARGGIYDEAALVEGLKSGKLGGVALDVFTTEPCTTSPLFGMEGVLATPHLGASTEEAQAQVAVEGIGLLIDYLTTGAIKNSVNMAPLDAKTLAEMRGDLEVAYRLGMFMAQVEIRARFYGGLIGVRYGEPYHLEGPLAVGDEARWACRADAADGTVVAGAANQ